MHEVGAGKVSACQPVFPLYKRGKGLSNMAILLKRMGQQAITVHGFRSRSFKRIAATCRLSERRGRENKVIAMPVSLDKDPMPDHDAD